MTYRLDDNQEWQIVRNCKEGSNGLSVLALNGQDHQYYGIGISTMVSAENRPAALLLRQPVSFLCSRKMIPSDKGVALFINQHEDTLVL